MSLRIGIGGDDEGQEVAVTRSATAAQVFIDGTRHEAVLRAAGKAFDLSVEDRTDRVWVAVDRDTVWVHAFGRAHRLEVVDPDERSARGAEHADTVTAPTPGTIVSVACDADAAVSAGDVLLVFESMKMQSEITAWRDGVVERVHQRAGESFDTGAALVSLVPEDDDEETGS